MDYTHFKTSIHTGFLSWKNMRQNDDVMMRITQNCTRTTQITMVTIYAHSKRCTCRPKYLLCKEKKPNKQPLFKFAQ